MNLRHLCILLFVAATLSCISQTTVATLNLSGTEVKLVAYQSSSPGPLLFNMHDDENTGVEASIKAIKKRGGTLYSLEHSGERYIEFDRDTSHFQIDPNRIYTDSGVWRELERAAFRDTVVFEMVRDFADTLITLMDIDNQPIVLTLHNNSEGNYSMRSYMPGEVYEVDAEAVYNGKWKDDDEFYFVTSARLYGLLTPTKFNVVLQNNAAMTDDGSLSVYCGQRGIEYVNVEAQHGHKRANRKMVKKMLEVLR